MKNFNTAAMCCLILAMSSLSACGSSSSSSSMLDNVRSQVLADTVRQPLASADGPHFQTSGGTDENLVIPLNGDSVRLRTAIIRSSDGIDYTYFIQNDALTITTTGTTSTTVTVAAAAHSGVFETDGTNSQVAGVRATLQTIMNEMDDGTGLAMAAVSVVVKGARDGDAPLLNLETGRLTSYTIDAYIFETEYSALGLWIETPSEFLAATADPLADRDARVFRFGLQTPASGLPSSGEVTFSGVAAGTYLRNDRGRLLQADRFLVGGSVDLTANFDTDAGISGTAILDAYNVADLATSSGMITVQLADPSGGSASNIDGATFDGNASIMGVPDTSGAFNELAGATGGFFGYFTGPEAEEAVGEVDLRTPQVNGNYDDILEFGFLTRQEPPSP